MQYIFCRYKNTNLKNFTSYIGALLCLLYLIFVSSWAQADSFTYLSSGQHNHPAEAQKVSQQLLQLPAVDSFRNQLIIDLQKIKNQLDNHSKITFTTPYETRIRQKCGEPISYWWWPFWSWPQCESIEDQVYPNNKNIQLYQNQFENADTILVSLKGETETFHDYIKINGEHYSGILDQKVVINSNQITVDFVSDFTNRKSGVTFSLKPSNQAIQPIIKDLETQIYPNIASAVDHFRQLLTKVADFNQTLAATYRAKLDTINSYQQGKMHNRTTPVVGSPAMLMGLAIGGTALSLAEIAAGGAAAIGAIGIGAHATEKIASILFHAIYGPQGRTSSSPLDYTEYANLRPESEKALLIDSLMPSTLRIDSQQGNLQIDHVNYQYNKKGTHASRNHDMDTGRGIYPTNLKLPNNDNDNDYYYISDHKIFYYRHLITSKDQITIYQLTAVIELDNDDSGTSGIARFWDYAADGRLLHYGQYNSHLDIPTTNNEEAFDIGLLSSQIRSNASPTHWINYQYLNIDGRNRIERLVFKPQYSSGLLKNITEFMQNYLHYNEDSAYMLYSDLSAEAEKASDFATSDLEGQLLTALIHNETDGYKLKTLLCHQKSDHCRSTDHPWNSRLIFDELNRAAYATGLSDASIAVVPSWVGIMQSEVNSKGIAVEHFQYLPVFGFEYTVNGNVKLLLADTNGEMSIDIPGDNKEQVYTQVVSSQSLEKSIQKQFDSGALAQYLPGKYYLKNHQAIKLIQSIVDHSSFPIANYQLIEELSRLTHIDQRYLSSSNDTLKSLSQRQALENLFFSSEYLTEEYVASNQKALDFLIKADNIVHSKYSNNRQQHKDILSKSSHSAFALNEEIAKRKAVSESGFYGGIRINNKTKNWQKELVIGEIFYGGNQDFFAVLTDGGGNIITVQIPISSHLSPSNQLMPSSIPEETIDRIKVSVNGLLWSDWYKMVDSEIEHYFNQMGIESPTDYMNYIVEILRQSKPVLEIFNQRRKETEDSNDQGQSAKLNNDSKYAINNLLNALAVFCVDDHRRGLAQRPEMQIIPKPNPEKERCHSGMEEENDLTDSDEQIVFEAQNSGSLNEQQSSSVSINTYVPSGEMQNNSVPQSLQIKPLGSMQNNAPQGSLIRVPTTIQSTSRNAVELCPIPLVQDGQAVVNITTTQQQQNQASTASANPYNSEIQGGMPEQPRGRNRRNHHHHHQICTLSNCIGVACFSSLIAIIYFGNHH